MKIIFALLAVFWLIAVPTQAQDSTPDYRPAVHHACRAFGLAFTNSLVSVQPKDGSASHLMLSYPLFAKNLSAAKISDCPQDFQLAWFDFSEAVRRFNKVKNLEHGAAAALFGIGVVEGGGGLAAREAAKHASKIESKDDIETAFAALKRLKIKYLAPPSAP
jgi:hypothetical protein